MPTSTFRRAPKTLPEPLEGWGLYRAPNMGRCIACGKYCNREVRRYSAKLLGRQSRILYPTAPYCYDHALLARAAIDMGMPMLVPSYWLDDEEQPQTPTDKDQHSESP